jgi:acyl-CoA reductase-like NAD-dependent aldehyde dehydrogenase
VSDIERKLESARARADNYGKLYGAKETADDYLKTTYALLYEDAPQGSVAERDAWVKRQDQYAEAIERKRDAYAAWKTAETYMKLLFAEADVYRTECANNRGFDRQSSGFSQRSTG